MKIFRVGVVGAGAIAQACHIPGYAKAKNCKLAAVADPDPKIIKEATGKWQFDRTYTNHKDMLANEELDVVSVCTPNAFHKQVAVDCLRAGCDLLLEKPVALTPAEANAIKAAAKKAGRRVMVGFSHRFNDWNVAARAAVKKGLIGRPYMIRVRFAHTGPQPGWAKTDWFYNPKIAGGGAMLDMAIHAFDLAQWYLGPATAVMAKAATLRKKIKLDDNNVSILEFGRAALGYIETGWTSPAGFLGAEIMGDEGYILVDYGAAKVTMIQGRDDAAGRTRRKTSVLAEGAKQSAWANEMEYFTAALSRRGPFAIGMDDGISALKIALAAYQSSRTGKRVALRG